MMFLFNDVLLTVIVLSFVNCYVLFPSLLSLDLIVTFNVWLYLSRIHVSHFLVIMLAFLFCFTAQFFDVRQTQQSVFSSRNNV